MNRGLFVLGLIIALGMIGGAVWGLTSDGGGTTPGDTSPSTFQPITFSGVDSRNTPPFTVNTDAWVIDWSYTTNEPTFAVFSFFVYRTGETVSYVESVLFPTQNSGSTYSYAGSGSYFLSVIVANLTSWTITIKPT